MKNAPNFRVPFYLALCIKISVGSHNRTLILIQRSAFFLCPKSLAPQGFFHLSGCMERAFPLFFGCKRRLMLVSPYSEVQVGCMIKRLLVAEPVAVLYWVHMQSSCFFRANVLFEHGMWNYNWQVLPPTHSRAVYNVHLVFSVISAYNKRE